MASWRSMDGLSRSKSPSKEGYVILVSPEGIKVDCAFQAPSGGGYLLDRIPLLYMFHRTRRFFKGHDPEKLPHRQLLWHCSHEAEWDGSFWSSRFSWIFDIEGYSQLYARGSQTGKNHPYIRDRLQSLSATRAAACRFVSLCRALSLLHTTCRSHDRSEVGFPHNLIKALWQ